MTQDTNTARAREDKDREAFESAYEAAQMPGEADWFRRDADEPDDYHHAGTAEAWWGWQAARATAKRDPLTQVALLSALIEGHWYAKEFRYLPGSINWASAVAAKLIEVQKKQDGERAHEIEVKK